MATEYAKIYSRFLAKISDYDILKFEVDDRELILENYLISSIVSFKRICEIDLSDRDDNLKQFNQDLDDEIIEILSIGMLSEWITPKVLNSEILRKNLNTKDWQQFSDANLIKELSALKERVDKQHKKMIVNYSYNVADFSKLNS